MGIGTAGRLACVPPRPTPSPVPAGAGDAESGSERRRCAARRPARRLPVRHRPDRHRHRGGAHPRTGRPKLLPVNRPQPFRTPGDAACHPLHPVKLRRVVHPHDGVPQATPAWQRFQRRRIETGRYQGNRRSERCGRSLDPEWPVCAGRTDDRGHPTVRLYRRGGWDYRPRPPVPPPVCWRRSSICRRYSALRPRCSGSELSSIDLRRLLRSSSENPPRGGPPPPGPRPPVPPPPWPPPPGPRLPAT